MRQESVKKVWAWRDPVQELDFKRENIVHSGVRYLPSLHYEK
nr:hypothetical protein [Pseudomonas sp. Marseille-Q3773]